MPFHGQKLIISPQYLSMVSMSIMSKFPLNFQKPLTFADEKSKQYREKVSRGGKLF